MVQRSIREDDSVITRQQRLDKISDKLELLAQDVPELFQHMQLTQALSILKNTRITEPKVHNEPHH